MIPLSETAAPTAAAATAATATAATAAAVPAKGPAVAAAATTTAPGPPRREQHHAPARRRNARGHGAQLADEIVAGALAILDRTGSSEAVTLRAVAREIGIAAPSIYAHFPDREAIVMAAVVQIFDELHDAIEEEVSRHEDPVERLVAGCAAYVAYGLEHGPRYRVLFSEERIADLAQCKPVSIGPDGRPLLEFGAESFALLVGALEACVESGASASTDVLGDATAIWVALHGAVSLRTSLTQFPWPPPGWLVRRFALALGRIPENDT
ncbi:MAG TPA: TetR/AcrR family transcriptional regulator [Acidimicrobiales bacterium]|nr:TetR/AcrR family transcriptional regulator [Acidimicrobiales bacterium]